MLYVGKLCYPRFIFVTEGPVIHANPFPPIEDAMTAACPVLRYGTTTDAWIDDENGKKFADLDDSKSTMGIFKSENFQWAVLIAAFLVELPCEGMTK
jgi:hypothetical protein